MICAFLDAGDCDGSSLAGRWQKLNGFKAQNASEVGLRGHCGSGQHALETLKMTLHGVKTSVVAKSILH
jgi:hypothetical protein